MGARSLLLSMLIAGVALSTGRIRGSEDDIGTFEVADVELATPLDGCRIRYSALVYAVPTGRIRVRPVASTPAAHSWYGE
jgi:hypothetical protein